MKSEIAKRIGVAVTFSSFWSLYDTSFRILAVIVIVLLIGSCIVLPFRGRLSRSRWGKKVGQGAMFEVTFAALGLSLVTSGIRLLTNGSGWWGVGAIGAGGFFIGAGLADNIKLRHRK